MDEKMKLSDKVYDKILLEISNGTWKPGMKISSENELAKNLGVARVSVREAVGKLEALGILEKNHGQGTFVSQLKTSIYYNSLIPMIILDVDKNSAIEVLEFRLLTDVESARLCALKCNEEDIKKIKYCYEQMKNNTHDKDKFSDFDIQFHMAITYGAKNGIIQKVHEILFDVLKLHQKKSAYKGGEPSSALKYHKKIMDSIMERDPEMAGIFMRRHIEYTIERIKKMEEL